MRKQAVVIGAVAGLAILGFLGCRVEVERSLFVGTWKNTATTGYSWGSIALHEDGTAELTYWNNNTAGPCTWTFTKEKLVVTDQAGKVQIDLNYKFQNAKTLILNGTPENVVMTGDGKYIKE
jgi:hypothetical protein